MYVRVVEPITPWQIRQTTRLYGLVIHEGAQIIPPEGKALTLTVNGVGHPIAPGEYYGNVVVSVSEPYVLEPNGLMRINQVRPLLRTAMVVTDNEIREQYGIPAVISRGEVTATGAKDVYMTSEEEDFNGFVLNGDTKYEISNSSFDMLGSGHNDWVGLGAVVAALDHSDVTIRDCCFAMSGYMRCAVHAAGHANLLVERCRLINVMPNATDWCEGFTWQMGFGGGGRLTQLADNAKVRYKDCELVCCNGWGVLAIDGTDDPEGLYAVELYAENCDITLSGPYTHGYGGFCIGENHMVYDHCRIDAVDYPILLMGMEGMGRFDVINGTRIFGRRFGARIAEDDNSVLNIADSEIVTDQSTLVVSGSATHIDVARSKMVPGNGVILQLADSDWYALNQQDFKVPIGVVDVRDPERDLSTVSETEDVTLNLTECDLCGDFYNSTTNIRAAAKSTAGTMGKLHDYVVGPFPPLEENPDQLLPKYLQLRHNGDDLCGAKNLGLNLCKTSLTGIVSSATQSYREGVAIITQANRCELCNITQESAPTVNNGVVVTLDAESVWTVTGPCYITGLDLAEGSVVCAPEGRTLCVKVNGEDATLVPGSYRGAIELFVE